MDVHALAHALLGFALKLTPAAATAHAQAAVSAAGTWHADLGLAPDETAELLLGLAYAESRYDMDALSRRECPPKQPCRRVTAVWRKKTKPRYARPSWFCGPVQTGGHVSWEECQRMREDATLAYATAARELHAWLRDPACRPHRGRARLVCGIRGYAGGYAAIRGGTLPYPHKVLVLAKAIRRRAAAFAARNSPRT